MCNGALNTGWVIIRKRSSLPCCACRLFPKLDNHCDILYNVICMYVCIHMLVCCAFNGNKSHVIVHAIFQCLSDMVSEVGYCEMIL